MMKIRFYRFSTVETTVLFLEDVQLPFESEVKQCLLYFPELIFTSSSALLLEKILKKSANMHS